MIRTIAPTVWAFDCEWVPAAAAGRRLLALAPDPDVFEAMWAAARARAGAPPDAPRPFLKLVHCRLASVAVVERRVCSTGEVVLRLCSLPREESDTEADILTAVSAETAVRMSADRSCPSGGSSPRPLPHVPLWSDVPVESDG